MIQEHLSIAPTINSKPLAAVVAFMLSLAQQQELSSSKINREFRLQTRM
jgi:hypothetical protein